jgi:hypothetical protein
VVSVGIGASVWAATGSAPAIPAAVAAGVLVDADHVLDFYYLYVKKDRRRIFVVLHGWEYSVVSLALVLGVWYHPALLAGVLGHLGHLVADHVRNNPAHPLAYSIAYRANSRFRYARLFPEPPATLSEALHHSIPLWDRIEPTLLRLSPGYRRAHR